MARASHLTAIAAALFLLLTGAAQAQQGHNALGGRFIALCKSPNAVGRDACGSVVASIMNAHVEMARQDPDHRIICPPRTLSVSEARRVFIQWADMTPNAASMPFPDLVMTALRDRYPCTNYLKSPGTRK